MIFITNNVKTSSHHHFPMTAMQYLFSYHYPLSIYNNLNRNVLMKKMNRSQSSYRQCKTLITQDDHDNLVSKYASKNYATRLPNAASNSFIQTNKENNSLFQSISERNFATKPREDISEFQAEKDETKYLKERCKKYEEQINRMHRERESQYQSCANLASSKHYNYVEQCQANEIEELRNQLAKKERELEYYRQEYSTRNQEAESISSELSSKLQRDQKDKNLLVKELNNKNIEISSMQSKLMYHRSQIQTLKIYLAEKDSVIQQLEEKLGQVDMKKKKIESYEFQLKESNEFLKELEVCTQKLKEETEQKDAIINQKRNDIMHLQQTIESYEDKLRAIEESLLKINQERRTYKDKNEELEREISDWKESYDTLLKKSQSIQEYELRLKAYMSMVDELNKSKTELTSANEKYKIAYTTIEKSLLKHQDIERELNELKKEMKEKNQKIQELQDQDRNRKHLEEYNTRLRKEKDQMYLKYQQKSKENKALSLQLDELKSKCKMAQEQLREIQQNNSRIKDRSEKLDTVMKQNTQLNETIIKKVDEIEKLEYKINHLQNKLNNLQNDLSRNQIQLEERDQENRELRIENEDIRSRYEAEISSKMITEDKLTKCSQEICSLKVQVSKLEERVTAFREEKETIIIRHQEEMIQVQSAIDVLVENKRQSEFLLQESNVKIAELKKEMEECKRGLEDSITKEKERLISIRNYEQKLIALQAQNQSLALKNREMSQHAHKIKEFSQLIIRLQHN